MHVFFLWSYLNPFDTSFLFISKNWIGNERKRRGLAIKRGPRDPVNSPKYVPGQKRKKSGYSVFKSSFLSGKKGKFIVYVWNHPFVTLKLLIIFATLLSALQIDLLWRWGLDGRI